MVLYPSQILVVAETNEAINNMARALLGVGVPAETLLRIGAPGRAADPDLKHVSFDERYR